MKSPRHHENSRNPWRFMEADSFRLFMEGLRSLQLYDKEFQRAKENGPPDQKALTQLLQDSERSLQDCVNDYPKDILPRYYLGIIFSMRGQVEQARELKASLNPASNNPDHVKPDDLFLSAAKLFERVSQEVKPTGDYKSSLLAFSQYNQAQALARTNPIGLGIEHKSKIPIAGAAEDSDDDVRHWDGALRILQTIDPNLVLTRLLWRDRFVARVRFVWWPKLSLGLSERRAVDEWLNQQKTPTPAELSAGVSAPVKATAEESRAFELQIRVLEYAIQLRKAVYRRDLTLDVLPPADRANEGAADKATIRNYMATIEDDRALDPESAKDIAADYWNKLAYVCCEAAEHNLQHIPSEWLARAENYLHVVNKYRLDWGPAQLTWARVEKLQGHDSQALQRLDCILGKETPPQLAPQPAPMPRPEESEAIVALIQTMAIERDPGVLANLILRDYGPVSRSTVRKVTEALAGKIDGKFLDDIFGFLSPVPDPSAGKGPT